MRVKEDEVREARTFRPEKKHATTRPLDGIQGLRAGRTESQSGVAFRSECVEHRGAADGLRERHDQRSPNGNRIALR